MIEIAAATPADDDARRLLGAYVEELNRRLPGGVQGLDTAWNEAEYGGSRGRIAVARLDGIPAGCAGLREHTTSAGEIKRFYVAPSARRRGVGRALLSWIEREARALGYGRLVLDTAAPLVEAAGLYEACGYARVLPFNDNPHADLWFERVLAS